MNPLLRLAFDRLRPNGEERVSLRRAGILWREGEASFTAFGSEDFGFLTALRCVRNERLVA